MLFYNAVGIDLASGVQEDLHPWTNQNPWALKAKAFKDPDLPTVRDALTGPHAEEFWKAMATEITSLQNLKTWEVVPSSSMPFGVKAISGTWAFRIAKWCIMGNWNERGVHYFEDAYSPLVGWPTMRSAMHPSAAAGWKSSQLDVTNAFCQTPQTSLLFTEQPHHSKSVDWREQNLVPLSSSSVPKQGRKVSPIVGIDVKEDWLFHKLQAHPPPLHVFAPAPPPWPDPSYQPLQVPLSIYHTLQSTGPLSSYIGAQADIHKGAAINSHMKSPRRYLLSVDKNVVVLLCSDVTFFYPSLPKAIEAVTSLQAGKFGKPRRQRLCIWSLALGLCCPQL